MNRGAWLELVGAVVDGVGLAVRISMETRSIGSPLFPVSPSSRKGCSDGLARGGTRACLSRVKSWWSSTMRNSTCAMLPASMTRRRGVQVRILSERKSVDAKDWAVSATVKTVAAKHHVCTDSHFTTRMITTGMWTRRMTML